MTNEKTTCSLCGAEWENNPGPLVLAVHMVLWHPVEFLSSGNVQDLITNKMFDAGARLADMLKEKTNAL
jgi:hypothetical protein